MWEKAAEPEYDRYGEIKPREGPKQLNPYCDLNKEFSFNETTELKIKVDSCNSFTRKTPSGIYLKVIGMNRCGCPFKVEPREKFLSGKLLGKINDIYADGSYYIGEQNHQNKKEGFGVNYVAAEGNLHEGYRLRGSCHGRGRSVWANENIYEGQFFEDKAQGYGKTYYKNGDVFEGNHVNNLQHDEWGRYTFVKSGNTVTCMFQNGEYIKD